MISFVIIGRNEERNLERCIKSIHNTIQLVPFHKYDIIYVDSASTDRSVQIAEQFTNIKIMLITGKCSAAIARNIGAIEAKGEMICFIDADMELQSGFFNNIFDTEGKPKFEFVSGQILDVYEDSSSKIRILNKYLPDGIFLISKQLWTSIQGMNTKYVTGEDLELGLRLHGKGVSIQKLPEIITKHFTVPTFHKSRLWKMIWNKSLFYSRCVLYRDHLLSIKMYQRFFQAEKTFILMVLTIASLAVNGKLFLLFLFVYVIATAIRSWKQEKHVSLLEYMLFYCVFDFLNLIYFFTFFPKKSRLEYIVLRS